MRIKRIRSVFARQIHDRAKALGFPVRKPKRYGLGAHMAVAVVECAFPPVDAEGIVDLTASLELLGRIKELLDFEIDPI